MIATTRSLAELEAQCRGAGIAVPLGASREQLFDLLRDHTGADLTLQLDPMRARDLRSEIDWTALGFSRFAPIARYFTDEWVMEPKLDGVRVRLHLGESTNSLITGRRSVKTFAYTNRSDNFPHLRDALVPELAGTTLDGELLAPSGRIRSHTGTWTDSLLNASVALCNSNPGDSVRTQVFFGKAQFFAFDVLTMKGSSAIQRLPLEVRRQRLRVAVDMLRLEYPGCAVHLVPQLPSNAGSIERSIKLGFEGVMVKRLSSPYQPGKRSQHWLKVKSFSTADAFVCGYNPGKNGNAGLVGSLDLAVRRLDGTDHPVAQVGNLSHEMRVAISADGGTLKPEFFGTVIEFSCQGLTKSGRARHASMVRIRPDKVANDCGEDQLDGFPNV